MTSPGSSMEMTANAIDLGLRAALGNPMTTPRFEGHCAGNTMTAVRRLVVCRSPTVDHVRRAAASGVDMLITREHPFYLHGGVMWAYTSEGLLNEDPVAVPTASATDRDLYTVTPLSAMPTVQAKQNLIDSSGMVIYRYAGLWDAFHPAAQSSALAAALGLVVADQERSSHRRGVVCDVASGTNLKALARSARTTTGARVIRAIGDTDRHLRRVAVLAGETDPVAGLADLLSDPRIDGIITGAGGILDEVDGGIAYFLDLMNFRQDISMLSIGYGASHEPGVRDMATFIQALIPPVAVEYWSTNDPSWTPNTRNEGTA